MKILGITQKLAKIFSKEATIPTSILQKISTAIATQNRERKGAKTRRKTEWILVKNLGCVLPGLVGANQVKIANFLILFQSLPWGLESQRTKEKNCLLRVVTRRLETEEISVRNLCGWVFRFAARNRGLWPIFFQVWNQALVWGMN